eukprot:14443169-Alexandrium_andersonii.AAC.3
MTSRASGSSSGGRPVRTGAVDYVVAIFWDFRAPPVGSLALVVGSCAVVAVGGGAFVRGARRGVVACGSRCGGIVFAFRAGLRGPFTRWRSVSAMADIELPVLVAGGLAASAPSPPSGPSAPAAIMPAVEPEAHR